MNNLQKLGGAAALFEAILYISAFVFFGLIWDFPSNSGIEQKLHYLIDNQTILYVVNFAMYLLFGIALAVLVLATHERLVRKSKILASMATVFGVVWIGLVMASGMMANIGLGVIINLSETEPEQVRAVWLSLDTVVEGMGGGNEIVGGLWVLFLSIAAIKGDELSKRLNYLGILVGTAGILTVYPDELLTEIFGISQLVWFAWLGLIMLHKPARILNEEPTTLSTSTP